MSQRVYEALTFGENVPFEVIVWDLCERFGWTYEYAESQSLARLAEFTQVQDGKARARNSLFNRPQGKKLKGW